MKLVLHDLSLDDFNKITVNDKNKFIVVSDNNSIKKCIGCFNCWIKTPGKCIINDKYNNMGKLISQCDECIVISKCYYGSFSPFIKNVFDRSINYILPYFTLRNGEMHHSLRYNNQVKISYFIYGDYNEEEKNLLIKIIDRNSINFNSNQNKIYFDKDIVNFQPLKEALS